ncbi:MAG: hypothetical protein HY775_11975 [Acidobacteria bacterium]|nr:hypothetical protein [Acidobacteriota bacterium]
MLASVFLLAPALPATGLAEPHGIVVPPATARAAAEFTVPLEPAPAAGPINVHALATGSTFPDIVKLGNLVVDEGRGRAYFSGSLSRHLGVVDVNTIQMVGTIDSGVDGFVSKHLLLNPVTGILYVFVIETGRLYRLDPTTGVLSGPVPGNGAVVDAGTDRVFVPSPPDQIQVYDGMLRLTGTVSGVRAPGDVHVDTASHRLYVLNALTGSNASVSVYDTVALDLVRKYAMPAGFDGTPTRVHADAGRIYVASRGPGATRAISIIDKATGAGTRVSVAENVNGMRTLAGKLYVMTGYPYYAGYLPNATGSFGVLEVRDATTGAKEREVQLDLESLYFEIDTTTSTLLYTATGRGTVGALHLPDLAPLGTIDVATTIEDVLVHPSDGSLYVRNRLGGSTLYHVNPATGVLLGTLDPGNWPTGLVLDAARGRLYALSHYEAKVTVFDITNDSLVGTINLGTSRARTDALSAMAMDHVLGKLYVVTPELGTLTAVNVDGSGSPVTVHIDGFTPNPRGGGPGQLHVTAHDALNRVYVFARDANRVNAYDASTLALVAHATTPDLNMTNPPLDLLFTDGARLFVGPHILDPLTLTPIGRIPSGLKVVGTGLGRYYVLDNAPGAPDNRERIREYDAAFVSDERGWDLEPTLGPHSAVGIDAARGRLYVGYLERGEVDSIDIGNALPGP